MKYEVINSRLMAVCRSFSRPLKSCFFAISFLGKKDKFQNQKLWIFFLIVIYAWRLKICTVTEKMGLTWVSIQLDGLTLWGVILVPKMDHFSLAALKLTEKIQSFLAPLFDKQNCIKTIANKYQWKSRFFVHKKWGPVVPKVVQKGLVRLKLKCIWSRGVNNRGAGVAIAPHILAE